MQKTKRHQFIVRLAHEVWRWVGYRAVDAGLSKGAFIAALLAAWLEDPGEVAASPLGPAQTTSIHLPVEA